MFVVYVNELINERTSLILFTNRTRDGSALLQKWIQRRTRLKKQRSAHHHYVILLLEFLVFVGLMYW